MPFSGRTPGDLTPNHWAQGLEQHRSSPLLDLTLSNPTLCGLNYPPGLLEPLGHHRSLRYEPEPFGLLSAREAVAQYLTSKEQKVRGDQLVLTASTSEAYAFLFKLLADPGDRLLFPTPSYPLLEHLSRLEGVELLACPSRQKPGWPLDEAAIRKNLSDRCRGLVVVNPNNPTGAFLGPKDQALVAHICRERSLAFISDEVFADFAYPGQVFTPWTPKDVLSFRLGGLSKSLGLPQLKLSWIILDGPPDELQECRERLELITDSYLSVNTPVQAALPELLRFAPNFQEQVLRRVLDNRGVLERTFQEGSGIRLWPAQGGWYALLEVLKPSGSDEDLVVHLMEKEGVLVQPGGFFDLEKGCFLVVSLLPEPGPFQEAASRLKRFLKA